jgi:predicted ATP-dependent endonuclease of OLD family
MSDQTKLRATVKLYNYRCFGDKEPGLLEFRPGFTAFVGSNNSGKSTLLRACRELRELIGTIANREILERWGGQDAISFSIQDVEDWTEIQFNGNAGRLAIEFTFHDAEELSVSRIRLTQTKRNTNSWATELFRGHHFVPITKERLAQNGLVAQLQASAPWNRIEITEVANFARLITRSMFVSKATY